MKIINVGIIGGGYMGKAHSVAARSVSAVFELDAEIVLAGIAASSPASAQRYAKKFDAKIAFDSPEQLINSDQIDAVIIASPQDTHLDYVRACAAVGKPVLCEKPMGRNTAEAAEIALAAKDIVNLVGYNYINTPATAHARQLIADGAIGDITWFRGEHNEDFMAPIGSGDGNWRLLGDANGTLGDLAPHMLQCALTLCGPINSLVADITSRPEVRDQDPSTPCNDDQVQLMTRFANGANGLLSFSRVAHGCKMRYAYEIHGTRGSLRFDQEDQNSLWLYQPEDGPNAGFKRILAGPDHGDYRHFCQGPAHGTGFQDQIIIEQANFFKAILSNTVAWPSFDDGVAVMRVMDGIRASHKTSGWISLSNN